MLNSTTTDRVCLLSSLRHVQKFHALELHDWNSQEFCLLLQNPKSLTSIFSIAARAILNVLRRANKEEDKDSPEPLNKNVFCQTTLTAGPM